MWTKITNDNDVLLLNVGDTLLQYPEIGEPTDTLNLADANNIARYEIKQFDGLTNIVRLVQETEDGMPIADATKPFPTHLIHISQLIYDGKWWREYEG